MGTLNIPELLKAARIEPPVKRLEYMPYRMDTALSVADAIGKAKSPQFVIDGDNRFVYENLIRWVQGDKAMQCLDPDTREVIPGDTAKGVYIAGGTGTGKSWCMEVMSAFCLADNPVAVLGGSFVSLRWRCVRVDEVCDEFTSTGDVSRWKRMPVACFQDLGSEPLESVHMGNREQPMRAIIESRGDRPDRITLITSNLPFTHPRFRERYGDRCVSRLTAMCNYFELKGKDRRR